MIYIDFDRTLFDTDAFLKDLEKILEKDNISLQLFNEYKVKQHNGFNPYEILDDLKKDYSFNQDIYNKIDNLIRNDYKYLYQDSIPFLSRLSKNHSLVLLTKGNELFQLKKIQACNILKYFNNIIVTNKHKGELNFYYDESIFIDDNPSEIESILSKKPKLVIRIKREQALYNDIEIKDKVVEVTSLEEILNNNLLKD